MTIGSTRRQFFTLAARGALSGWLLSGNAGRASPLRGAGAGPPGTATKWDRPAVEAEIRRRADWQLRQTRLVVDYYRIGRKIAYPLPLSELVIPEVRVPSISVYPWATWLLWTLEERIASLGWAAEWFGDEKARQAAEADLTALAQWPSYQQYDGPDLSSAHAARILWTASTRWRWVDDALGRSLRAACIRHVNAVLPASEKIYGSVHAREDVLAPDGPRVSLHNIPLIGTLGAALTAAAAGDESSEVLNNRLQALFGAVLDLRVKGYSEGVAYDGYVLDFVADWLATLPEAERSAVLDHSSLDHYLDQSYMLGAPGAAEQVAELGDVEPREMPFHLSAQAKLQSLQTNQVRSWLLARCHTAIFRSDALAAIGTLGTLLDAKTPNAGALDAHYAAVLRSGWEAHDLAVAVSCSISPMGHLQSDSGTLVIGTRGTWLIADPGYQQYVAGDEREFTIGPKAHNAPLINTYGPTQKRPRRIVLENVGRNVHRTVIDLTACYPPAAGLKSLVRNVWLAGNNLVVVADLLEADGRPPAVYHWHGQPEAAWWFEAGWALLALRDARLWFTDSRGRFSGADLQRLPGSRGQLSLISTIEDTGPVVWWVFAAVNARPDLQASADGREIRILGQVFQV